MRFQNVVPRDPSIIARHLAVKIPGGFAKNKCTRVSTSEPLKLVRGSCHRTASNHNRSRVHVISVVGIKTDETSYSFVKRAVSFLQPSTGC